MCGPAGWCTYGSMPELFARLGKKALSARQLPKSQDRVETHRDLKSDGDSDQAQCRAYIDAYGAITHGDRVGARGDHDCAHGSVDFLDLRRAVIDSGAPAG